MAASSEPRPSYAGVPEVLEHLKEQGWDLSERTLYRHVSERKLKKGADGHFASAAVATYAKRYLKRVDGSSARSDRAELLGMARGEAELKKLSAEAERQVLRLEQERGNLLERSRVEEEWAAAFQLLKSSFETWAHEAADAVLELVRGDAERQPELLRYLLESTEDYFAQFAEEREWVVELGDE